jgi:hypothetical protein
MARQKLFYTKNQITENLYTSGSEYQLIDGTMYMGLYHTYTTGEVYTEASWNPSKSKKLEPFVIVSEQVNIYKKNNPDIKTKFDSPEKYFPEITATDIQQKFIKRYFLYKINDRQVTEISLSQYNKWYSQKLDNNIYVTFELNWYITGAAENIVSGNVTTLGVIQKNQTTINLINRRYPGFRDTVNNPLELYVDTTIIVPPAIN